MTNKIINIELDDDEFFYVGYVLGIASSVLKNDVIAQRTILKMLRSYESATVKN